MEILNLLAMEGDGDRLGGLILKFGSPFVFAQLSYALSWTRLQS